MAKPKPKTREELVQQAREAVVRFPSKSSAERALSIMENMLSDYGYVTVADLKELAGQSASIFDEQWGWSHVEHIGLQKERGSWILVLPEKEQVAR